MLKKLFKERPQDAHKGLFGHVFILGGDCGMPGAPILATKGTALMGAGLITVITRPEHILGVVSHHPEALCYGLLYNQTAELQTLLKHATVIVLGPGLGQSNWSKQLFKKAIKHIQVHQTPAVIDADALNLLSKMPESLLKNLKTTNSCVFTPHAGEAGRLLNRSAESIQANRKQSVEALLNKLGGTIVLKGANTLVCSENHPFFYV